MFEGNLTLFLTPNARNSSVEEIEMENTEHEKEDQELKDIGQFYGSQSYHNIGMGVVGTDGIDYVMRNGYAWAVTDACVILKGQKKVMNEEFVAVKLQLPGGWSNKNCL